MKNRTIDLVDVALPMNEGGAGEPMILLHGALGDRRTLSPVAERLSARHRTIVPTQRHFGVEPRPRGDLPFGTDQQARDLLAAFDVLGLEKAHVVAWSFSAHSALAAACREPARFSSLFLYELGFPTFVTDATSLHTIATDGREAFAPVFEAAGCADWEEAARRLIDAAARRQGHYDTQGEEIRAVHRDNSDTIALLLAQTPPVEIEACDLQTLTVPTTIAWGARTRTSYRLICEAAAEAIPQARQLCVPDAGHLLPEEDPHAFARLVAEAVAIFSSDDETAHDLLFPKH